MATCRVGSCSQCDARRILRPVAVFPGFAGPDCAVVIELCLWCRLDWRDDKWCALVESFVHSARRDARECGQWALEWLNRTPAAA